MPVITERDLSGDVVVVGGGLSGLCAAVAACRHGARVVLVQDRPMLGGNASSEIRMGICGAHGKGRKETGILEELQLNNVFYNPLMRYTLWDDQMLSLALAEQNLTLLLNTSVDDVTMDGTTIRSVTAWTLNEYCRYHISARTFIDCSGDAILRLSGAEYRHGSEAANEFHESFRQTPQATPYTMGNSILLQLRKTSEHHPFLPPPWAHKYDDDFFAKRVRPLTPDPDERSYINPFPQNNNFWWIETGGLLDTISDAGEIQRELKKIAYGVWDYMKNHPDGRCRDYDLDWIGSLPGKRESVRYVGDLILNQNHIMEGGQFPDNVCYGGWTLDDHYPEAFLREGSVSLHHRPPSPFGIPFRALYSRNISNLLFAGRDISCTHIGLSAVRVMATCALMGQAVGTAAALALPYQETPREFGQNHIRELQNALLEDDVMIPGFTRQVADVTLAAHASHPVLQTPQDRNMDDADHGAWLPLDEPATYTWDTPVTLSSVRAVFDTNVADFNDKRMRKLEALPDRKPMPPMLARTFRLEASVDGAWRTLAREDNFHARLYRKTFPTIQTAAVRLVIERAWGPLPFAHVFCLEFR
ncbi:MAG: FAD-dependent oxidoreductase [Victivallales bacterium]|nr:FAD-dependent oxidoreductase [Victivallales bacterium]